MIAHHAVLLDTIRMPANARNVAIYDHGHRLLHVPDYGDTPEQDGCQSSFIRSRRNQRIVAEWATCGQNEILNFTRHQLTIRWETN